MREHRFPLIALGVATSVLTLAGCSALEGANDPASTPAPPASSGAASGTPAGGAPTSGTPTAGPSGLPSTLGATPSPLQPPPPSGTGASVVPGQLGDPVTSRTASRDGKKLTVEVYPVLRAGVVSHLNLMISAPGSGPDGVYLSTLLSDGNATTSDKSPWAADGVQLIDGRNGKLYLVASDGQGQCLCSRDLSATRVIETVPVLVSASFATPPPDVTTVDVRIPNFGTVTGVPVQ